MVDSSQTRLAYITEVTYGTTPASPVFKNQRFVSENLNANLENVVSNEIRADRNVTDLIQVGAYEAGSNPEVDEAIRLRPAMENFLRQDMHIGEVEVNTRESLRSLMAS